MWRRRSMRVLVNTSPLIALDRIRRLDLLRQLYGQVIRPQAVLEELEAGRAHWRATETLWHAEWIVTEPDPPEMVLRKDLGAGETAVLALAYKRGADLVILDDLHARLIAAELGLKITGTLGVLLAAHHCGLETDLSHALADLRAAGFHVSEKLLQQFQAP